MQTAATAPALAPPVFLTINHPTAASASARPRRAGRAAVRCELAAAAAPAAPGSVATPRWAQRTVVIPPQRRGCHIITHKIMHAIRSDLSEFKCGLAHLFYPRKRREQRGKQPRQARPPHALSRHRRRALRLPNPRQPSPVMQTAATAPALAPPVFLTLTLPTASIASARPRRAARAAVRCELAAAAPAAPGSVAAPRWAQRTVVIPPQRRGCHIITHKIMHAIRSDLSEFKCGLAHLFLHHTSASLTLNENYDPDVQADTETFLNRVVPEGPSAPWRHTIEGPDDMPAHIKSSMFGCALTIPITDGRLNMGTWQGIWLCEHRDDPTPRTIVITLSGI